jgi:hypothetical protein
MRITLKLMGVLTLALALAGLASAVVALWSDREPTAATVNLLHEPGRAASWAVDCQPDAEAVAAEDKGAVRFTVTKTTGTNWHVQVYQNGLPLKDGVTYRVRFRARAERPTPSYVGASVQEGDYHGVWTADEFEMGTEWKEFSFTHVTSRAAPGAANRAPVIGIGVARGSIWIADASVEAVP